MRRALSSLRAGGIPDAESSGGALSPARPAALPPCASAPHTPRSAWPTPRGSVPSAGSSHFPLPARQSQDVGCQCPRPGAASLSAGTSGGRARALEETGLPLSRLPRHLVAGRRVRGRLPGSRDTARVCSVNEVERGSSTGAKLTPARLGREGAVVGLGWAGGRGRRLPQGGGGLPCPPVGAALAAGAWR